MWCLVKATLRLLYTRKAGPVPILQGAGLATAPVWAGTGKLALPTWFRSPDCPALNELLCRLSYSGLQLNCYFQGNMVKVCACHKDVWGTGE
jgi:hypothetical protein